MNSSAILWLETESDQWYSPWNQPWNQMTHCSMTKTERAITPKCQKREQLVRQWQTGGEICKIWTDGGIVRRRRREGKSQRDKGKAMRQALLVHVEVCVVWGGSALHSIIAVREIHSFSPLAYLSIPRWCRQPAFGWRISALKSPVRPISLLLSPSSPVGLIPSLCCSRLNAPLSCRRVCVLCVVCVRARVRSRTHVGVLPQH